MAANAIERHVLPLTNSLQLLAASPERLEFATRLALICALTTLVTEVYQTPDPALSAYVVFFMNRPERTESLILSAAFMVIIAVVLALLLIVVNFVADDPMWRVISIAVISFGLLFLGSASKLRPIAGTVALIAGYVLDLLGTIQTGELATRALLYTWLFVAGIPAGVSILVNLVLGPSPRRTVERVIADRLRLCAAALRQSDSPATRELSAQVREGVAPLLKQLGLAGIEKSVPARDIAALKQATLSSFALMTAVEALATSPEGALACPVRIKLADAVEQLTGAVQRGESPVAVTLELPDQTACSPLARELLTSIRDAVARFAESGTPMRAPPKKKEGFLVEDAFSNPEHVQYALKTTAAAVFCYLLYSLLDWPGIHTCFLTCYIVAQSTAAESVEKLSLRIIGCLIGAAAGYAAIVFLVPALTSIGGLMIAVFAGGWAAAYVAGGSPRIGYAGFQIALAFFLCIIQGSGPAFDLTIARDRIIGIIIGNLVSYFMLVYLWPVTITRRVNPALAAALRQLAKIPSTNDSRERVLLSSQAHGTLTEAETAIALAQYEPSSIRASPTWLAARRAQVENSQSLANWLLLSTDARELSRADVAGRLERLAMHLTEPSDAARAPSPANEWVAVSETPTGQATRRLQALEKTLAPGIPETEAIAHAHA